MASDNIVINYFVFLYSPASVSNWEYWLFSSINGILACVFFFSVYHFLRQCRLMEDTPTAKIRSASQGFVELEGIQKPLNPLHAPLTGRACTWYKYKLQKSVRQGKKTSWVTLSEGESTEPFLLDDDTGLCVVHPEGADINPSYSHQWYGKSEIPTKESFDKQTLMGKFCYSEEILEPETHLYALGMFRTINNVDRLPNVGDVVHHWKRDFARFLERFDANGDGKIDADEHKAAVKAAEEEIARMHQEGEEYDTINILSKEGLDKRHHFILSAQDQDEIIEERRSFAKYSTIAALLFFGQTLYALSILL